MPLVALYPWLKAFHVAFMVTWFAGLFYLPRLFIYHVESADEPSRQRFSVMEFRLFVIMTVGAALTALFGFILLLINSGLLQQTWFQLKLLLLGAMIVYHVRCWQRITALRRGVTPQDTRWLRWFNEIPMIFLLGIVWLAIVKPF
ncbi:MAG: CopD family protein [Woeseiaceae bacterium]